MNYIEAIIIAIVEGITEFLPISSTGHMIITSKLLGVDMTDSFNKFFIVCIQLGAILSVVVLYWKKFVAEVDFKRLFSAFRNHSFFSKLFWTEIFESKIFYFKLLVAFLPAAFFGLLLKKHIDLLLESVEVVAYSLFIGGILLLFVDKWFKANEPDTNPENQKVSFKKAFFIGCFQVISMIPGVSRSAATIVGGMSNKLTRKNAAEFSFFLAVPTMLAATAKDLLDYYQDGLSISMHQLSLLAVGNIVAFIVALFAIKSFISFLTKKGFVVFGYYRIAIGLAILILLQLGYTLKIV
ncbi:MAG: undecaprenyl-diphosphate phosphatase [Bacteroidota bacterium]